MTDQNELKPDEARAALQSVEEMQRAGIRAGSPPLWFLILGALCVGGLFAAQALEEPGLVTGPLLLAMCVTVFIKRRTMGAWRRKFDGPASVLLAAAAGAVAIGLFVAMKVAQEGYGLLWAPPAAGALAALVLLAVGAAQRGRGA